MEQTRTPEQEADFEARKKIAVAEMDAALTRHQVGIQLGMSGLPYKLQPVIIYTDLKKDEKTKPTKDKKQRGK